MSDYYNLEKQEQLLKCRPYFYFPEAEASLSLAAQIAEFRVECLLPRHVLEINGEVINCIDDLLELLEFLVGDRSV